MVCRGVFTDLDCNARGEREAHVRAFERSTVCCIPHTAFLNCIHAGSDDGYSKVQGCLLPEQGLRRHQNTELWLALIGRIVDRPAASIEAVYPLYRHQSPCSRSRRNCAPDRPLLKVRPLLESVDLCTVVDTSAELLRFECVPTNEPSCSGSTSRSYPLAQLARPKLSAILPLCGVSNFFLIST